MPLRVLIAGLMVIVFAACGRRPPVDGGPIISLHTGVERPLIQPQTEPDSGSVEHMFHVRARMVSGSTQALLQAGLLRGDAVLMSVAEVTMGLASAELAVDDFAATTGYPGRMTTARCIEQYASLIGYELVGEPDDGLAIDLLADVLNFGSVLQFRGRVDAGVAVLDTLTVEQVQVLELFYGSCRPHPELPLREPLAHGQALPFEESLIAWGTYHHETGELRLLAGQVLVVPLRWRLERTMSNIRLFADLTDWPSRKESIRRPVPTVLLLEINAERLPEPIDPVDPESAVFPPARLGWQKSSIARGK